MESMNPNYSDIKLNGQSWKQRAIG